MAAPAPFGGGTFIADTSPWARAYDPGVRTQWLEALKARQIATCPIVNLELLRSIRDGDAFDRLAGDLANLRDIPITRSVTNGAMRAFGELTHRSPGAHRVPRVPDLLIAAAAEDASAGVLHYGRHFDLLATVLAFESRWIAPPGSLP